jgi:membrane dipeptidase
MRPARAIFLFTIVLLLATNSLVRTIPADDIAARAHKLHFSSLVIDTHDDTTQRMFSKDYDLGKRNADGAVDIPRMREGGMNGIFFSIWIDGRTMGPPAIQKALDQIDAIRENVKRYPHEIILARTADEVRRAHSQGKIAALLGVEDRQRHPPGAHFLRSRRALHDADPFL